MLYFNFFIGVFIVICYLAIIYLANKNTYFIFIDKILHFIFSIYISLLIKIMIFPIPINKKIIASDIKNNFGLKHNYIPLINIFKNINDSVSNIVVYNMIIGNFLPFIPIGFIICIFVKNRWNKPKIFKIGFVISASKELLQLIISFLIGYNYKGFDIDSIILSFIGYLIGFMLCSLFATEVQNQWN
ncbi:VanZ family protein [Tepidibacter thalassicus]|uniref:VanZ like family protein n=1 Tax=Tepidibacter thalassicus DSM 15285 TaxID=1123350 RepID=A0A1M5Q2H0_9FIRM|nr:VanZ family protein [Tepidibacter thalassicus]SHH07919.1 VanZ like family protein [Tepidibacter thalassicus DSM 15285]